MDSKIKVEIKLTMPDGNVVAQSFDMDVPGQGNVERINEGAKATPQDGRMALSMNETAEVLGMSYVTVWRLVQRGRLRPVAGIRHKKIPMKEIERFLAHGVRV